MTEEEKKKDEVVTVELTEEIEEEEVDEIIEENVAKIELLIDELNKINQKGGPDIRICPRCFSLRIKIEDILAGMGMDNSYPTCRCLDCGWRSRRWIYLDRKLTNEERERFLSDLVKENIEE